MVRFQTDLRVWLASILAGLATISGAPAATMVEDAALACGGLAGSLDAVRIDSATLQTPSQLAVSERAPTPAARIAPANPAFCKVLGHIEPTDLNAPPIKFEVNLPVEWNGRSVQYGGGGFNGTLITGLGLPPAYPFDRPAPLARGFVTYGTDSGHESKPGEPPQVFALNDEAFENFAYRSYKKVRDAAVALMVRAYGKSPQKIYFMGSSEGGREGLTMAQRYPDDFDGIFARVPVINWVGLQHAGMRSGLVTMGEGWIRPAQVKLVADAVRQACDKADGSGDSLVQNPVGCKATFKADSLHCAGGQSGDRCLTDAQIKAKTHFCAGARPLRNRFCEDTAPLMHNRLPDPRRQRVLRLIGKGAVVVGQVRIVLTNAAASGDRRPTLLHGREAAGSYSARTVIDAAILTRARGSGCRHCNPSQRERRSGYSQKLFHLSLSVCVGFSPKISQ
jgi:feruloyl esterase